MMSLLRLGLIASSLFLVTGCAAIRDAHNRSFAKPSDPSLAHLGSVSISGGGSMPPQSVLRETLREQAARQFGVPVEEIVLTDVDIGGSQEVNSEVEYANAGVATVALPPRQRSESSWSASAEASRRLPKQN